MFEQVSFLHPLALLLIPLLWLLIVLALLLRRRIQQWEHLIERNFHHKLLISLPASGRFWPSILLGLAGLCLAVALSQPQFNSKITVSTQAEHLPLVILLPLTTESLRTDLAPSRLQLMQAQAMQLTSQRLPSQTALVAYAASAHTMAALNDNSAAMHNLIQAAQPELMPAQGQDAAAAVKLAQQLLEQGRQPQGEILLYVNQLSHGEQQQIKHILKSRHQLTIVSASNHAELATWSKKHGYNHQQLQHFSTSYQPASSQYTTSSAKQHEQGYWLLPFVLLLLAPLARKGWLLMLPLALIFPPQGQANQTHTTIMWQAIAAYEANNYQQASQLFASIDGAAARYNQANALMHLGQFQQAIALYQQALQLDPLLNQANLNLELAKQLQQQNDAEQAQNHNQHSKIKGEQLLPESPEQTPQPHQQVDLATWLQQIPDQPGTLFKQVFWYEYHDMEQQP